MKDQVAQSNCIGRAAIHHLDSKAGLSRTNVHPWLPKRETLLLVFILAFHLMYPAGEREGGKKHVSTNLIITYSLLLYTQTALEAVCQIYYELGNEWNSMLLSDCCLSNTARQLLYGSLKLFCADGLV